MNLIEKLYGSPDRKFKTLTGIFVFILLSIIIIFQLLRVIQAIPLFAYAYVENSGSPSQVFPQFSVCPMRINSSLIGEISKIQCFFQNSIDNSQKTLTSSPSQRLIDSNPYSCMDVNMDQSVAAHSLSDYIQCKVWSNSNILSSYFDSSSGSPQNWFAWTSIPQGQDTALGLIKWFYNGQELGFQVKTTQQEFRFSNPQKDYDLLFTVQWDFLGEGVFGEFWTGDFWTSLGISGAFIWMGLQFYTGLIWIGHNCMKIPPDEIRGTPLVSETTTSHYDTL